MDEINTTHERVDIRRSRRIPDTQINWGETLDTCEQKRVMSLSCLSPPQLPSHTVAGVRISTLGLAGG